jgi:tetratricopeptide (TPR) repeat protein
VAALIMRTWPKEPEGVEAAQIVVASAAESHDAERLVKLIADVPRDSAKGAEVLLRAGGALWREIIERRRLPEDVRPAPEILAAWRSRAVEALDAGLAAMPAGGAGSPVAVAGGLARCQIAIEEGDQALAAKLLEQPSWGGWTVLSSGDAAYGSGPLAENAATVALRFFIQSQQLDKAQQAFDKLEAVAGTGPEATAKLTNMYLSMGRDLQGQLEALAAKQGATQGNGLAESEGTALGILAGFEKFLEGVAKRDAKVASQMWVATTYLSLGSGSGSATVVPRAKASGYLARAAEVYEGLLKRSGGSAGLADGADEIARFVPSIRLKLASVYRELGRWDEALGHVDWILSDAKRQNSLDAQIQAAELLQAAGEKATDGAASARFLREAIAGRKSQGGVAWGWGGIANRLARQAADPKAIDARAKFFTARLNVVRCRLALLAKPGQDRAKLLQMAFNDVAVTYRLYPDLGGDAFRAQFDALLKQIQKERGEASPRGLAELDETPVAAS